MSPRIARIGRVAASVILLLLVISFADWDAVWHVLRSIDPWWVAAAFVIAALDRLIINIRWQILLEARGVTVGFLRLARMQMGANFLGSFLPSSIGVDALRITALCRAGERAPVVIAATVMDRMSLTIGTLLLGGAMLVLFARSLVPTAVTWAVLIACAIVMVASVSLLNGATRRWIRLATLARVPRRFKAVVHETAGALLAYRHERGVLILVAVLTALAFVVRIYFVQALAHSVGVDLSISGFLVIVPILWLIVMLPITIGGIGVQDAGYVGLMAFLGVPAPLAVSMSLLEHVVARVGSLPGALFITDTIGRRAQIAAAPRSAQDGCGPPE